MTANFVGSLMSILTSVWMGQIIVFADDSSVREDDLQEEHSHYYGYSENAHMKEAELEHQHIGALKIFGVVAIVGSILLAILMFKNGLEIALMLCNRSKLPSVLQKVRDRMESEYIGCIERQGYKVVFKKATGMT